MGSVIDRDHLKQLMAGGVQLVEVLRAAEYKEDHLPGAINIPLKLVSRETASTLDPNRPLVVYCWDTA